LSATTCANDDDKAKRGAPRAELSTHNRLNAENIIRRRKPSGDGRTSLRRKGVSPRIELLKPFVPRLYMPKLGKWNLSGSGIRKGSGQCEICDSQGLPDRDAVTGEMVVEHTSM
jgi:hypothetical protein